MVPVVMVSDPICSRVHGKTVVCPLLFLGGRGREASSYPD